MGVDYITGLIVAVALRKESVDRNNAVAVPIERPLRSLSARRAWIEIIQYNIQSVSNFVALRKESVDRNNPSNVKSFNVSSRSPQGERG